jgi:hypothetical protein
MKLYTMFLILAAAALGHATNVDPVAMAPPDEIHDSVESVESVDPMDLPVEPLGQMGGLRELVRTEYGDSTLFASLWRPAMP